MFGDSEFFKLKNAHTLYTMNTHNGVWSSRSHTLLEVDLMFTVKEIKAL